MPSRIELRPFSALRDLLTGEAAGGVVLAIATLLALLVANSGLAPGYFAALHRYAGGLSVLHWIHDGLMALFFLHVGLELKREVLAGQLSTWERRTLPAAAALGGISALAGVSGFVLLRGAKEDPAC